MEAAQHAAPLTIEGEQEFQRILFRDLDHQLGCQAERNHFVARVVPIRFAPSSKRARHMEDILRKVKIGAPKAFIECEPRMHIVVCTDCGASEIRYGVSVRVSIAHLSFSREFAL